jgi:hypothetical protein
MANMLFANNANTTLNGGITAVATSMVVTSATGFPAPTGSQYFYCTLADAATQTTIEIVKVTAVSGTTFTIVRGQDGTTGTAFAAGDVVSLRLVRASLNDFPKLDENNTFSYAPTFNTALAVGSGGTGVTSATGTGAGASVVLSQAPAINSPVITSYSTSTVPLKVFGLSGQITELFDVYTYNGGTLAFQINSSGAIATGTWNASVIGAAYGGTGEAGTLTGILYGNGTSPHTVATTAQLLSGIGTLPVANGGTGLTSLTAGYIPYGNGTSAFSSSSSLTFDGTNLSVGGISYTNSKFAINGNGAVPTSTALQIGSNGVGSRFAYNVPSGGEHDFTVNGSTVVAINASLLAPVPDNTLTLGAASLRWTTVYATTALINTSDANTKQQIAPLSEAEITVAKSIKNLFKTFKFNESVIKKGANARIHVGVIAQDIQSAFSNAGLNADNYGLFCSDTWYEVDESQFDSKGEAYTSSSPNAVPVTQLGIRYEELLAFVIAAI